MTQLPVYAIYLPRNNSCVSLDGRQLFFSQDREMVETKAKNFAQKEQTPVMLLASVRLYTPAILPVEVTEMTP